MVNQQPVTNGYHIAKSRYRKFLSLLKVLLDGSLCGKVKNCDSITEVGGNDRKDVEKKTLGFEKQKSSN